MQGLKAAVGLHLTDSGVHYIQEVILPFPHQHANLAAGERLVQQRCGQANFSLSPPGFTITRTSG